MPIQKVTVHPVYIMKDKKVPSKDSASAKETDEDKVCTSLVVYFVCM